MSSVFVHSPFCIDWAYEQTTDAGIRYAGDGCGGAAEVIVASSSDVAGTGMIEGVYLVQTGATGVAETFCTLG
eukprot:SAG31_NODE_32086_length_360_cov_0.793103_1_plen_72_part_10